MKLESTYKGGIVGIQEITKIDRAGNREVIDPKQNVILLQSSTIMRDLMYDGLGGRIAFMGFGDLNLDESDDLVNIPEALETDTGLIHEVGRVAITKESLIVEGVPAIRYTAFLDYNQLNGSGRQIITEYCLITTDNRAFNKKNRSALIKDSEFAYEFKWTLRFV